MFGVLLATDEPDRTSGGLARTRAGLLPPGTATGAADRIVAEQATEKGVAGCLSGGPTVTRRKRRQTAGDQSRSFAGEGNLAAVPTDRRKTGLRVAGGGRGRCGVSPLEWVAPHEIGALGKAFPVRHPILDSGEKDQHARSKADCFRAGA